MIKNDKEKLKVLHITAVREISAGQRKQLKYEYNASNNISKVDWTTLVLHTSTPVEPFEKRIPLFFHMIFLRNLYAWYVAVKLKDDFDIILFRHMPFDPFVFLFAPMIKNRVSVHHAKEVEELLLIRKGLIGRLVSSLEYITGKFAVKRTIGILGVTNDIAHYQATTRAPYKPYDTYPNGISLNEVALAKDCRIEQEINVVFISGTFSEWHGLDRLITAVDSMPIETTIALKIHLIGKLSEFQRQEIKSTSIRSEIFIEHGTLRLEKYKEIVEKCDVGLGSLAMDRQNLTEGATLKVRELLAMGIPLYSGHIDTALAIDFLFYKYAKNLSIIDLIEFAKDMKKYSREEVRNTSANFIDKTLILEGMGKKLYNFL